MTRLRSGLVVAAALVAFAGCGEDQSASESITVTDVDDVGEFDHEYVIPLGTSFRIASGEDVEIVPRELVVEVGDSIRIINEDDRGHSVGVFYVGAGESLTQRFDSPGVLEGLCSVHPSGAFTLRVEA